MESISEQLKTYRLRRGLTQEQLAKASGLTGGQIAHVERGARNLSAVSAARIADALDLDRSERSDFMRAREAAAIERLAGGAATSPPGDDPLVVKVRLDLEAAEAWGRDQTYRLAVLRRLYEMDEREFHDEMLEDMIREFAGEGDPRDLITHVEDRVNAYVEAEEQHFADTYDPADFALAAQDDEDGVLDGRTETPAEETPEV